MPVKVLSKANPYVGNQEAILTGKKVFRQHWTQCHGEDGRGIGQAADFHSSNIKNAQPGALFWTIQNGRLRRGMPAWSQLSDQLI